MLTCLVQMSACQVLRPPFSPFNRPMAETLLETSSFFPAPSPTVISEPPINSLVSLPNVVSEPSTTIITDCSPTICKNLANTIQLMIVCNLLQNNKGGSELAMQLAAPIINEVMNSPTLSCGCPNPISPVAASPNYITPSVVSQANIIGSNAVPLTPRVVSPNNIIPNVGSISPSLPIAGQVPNANCLLNSLMSLLGNVQG